MPTKIKLFFRLPEGASYPTESVWAEYKTPELLVVLNSPFYAKGVSFLDEVHFTVEDDVPYFTEVVHKSGHSTYRILQQTEDQKESFERYWRALQDIGCTYESKIDIGKTLYSVNVPLEADIKQAYEFLEKGEKEGVWFFEEADYGRA